MNENVLQFQKTDLLEAGYLWNDIPTEGSIPKVTEPSRRLFNRYNGDHILNMINYFANVVQRINVKDVRVIETLLREHLPFGVKSEISVFRWLMSTHTANAC